MLQRVLDDKAHESRSAIEYNQCNDACELIPSNFPQSVDDDDMPWNTKYKDRKKCYDDCQKLKPKDVILGC